MNELEELIRQKKELEKRIKELKNQASVVGKTKIDVAHYTSVDRHYLAVFYEPLNHGRKKWSTIFSSNNKQSVIDAIPSIIEDLQELYNRNKE